MDEAGASRGPPNFFLQPFPPPRHSLKNLRRICVATPRPDCCTLKRGAERIQVESV
jgi:hypothetical protein